MTLFPPQISRRGNSDGLGGGGFESARIHSRPFNKRCPLRKSVFRRVVRDGMDAVIVRRRGLPNIHLSQGTG